ncbi:MAG: phosphate acyltransferase PlsX [Clostridia bacterium]|nr:phosphate acyltransferase PlsX [Clostridia bacterium]
MKIILDCFGGDNCPNSAIDGALLALEENKELAITLCGDESVIGAYLADKTYDKSRINILHASEVVTNDDLPTLAVRRKKQSSMMLGLQTLASEEYDGMVSSGNTGALLIGATIFVKLIEGVQRATLSPLLPTMIDGKSTILVDGGANVDCKASMLKEFAIMGSTFMSSTSGIESPKVALLNNGVEEGKGNALTKEAYALLKESDLNFVGNVEARELFAGEADVIVADGFAGNMSMKSAEGMGKTIFTMLKRYITEGGLRAKLGYLLLKPSLKKIKSLMSSDTVGGGVFLGVKKVVVKAHGASNAVAFKNAIVRAKEMAEADVCSKIASALGSNIKDTEI